jgi:hypothetical protein
MIKRYYALRGDCVKTRVFASWTLFSFRIDSKFTYHGVPSWFHIVVRRLDIDSDCSSTLSAPSGLEIQKGSKIGETMFFTPDPITQPRPPGRQNF